MDDYYELLGVDPEAATDEIRTAYRERKAALDSSSDSGRADAAKLNRAWNVLSDPYQRGRYDEQRSRADGDDDHDEDEIEVSTNGKGSRTPARGGGRQTRQGRQMGPPTITPPEGTRFPQPKQRVIAMIIDLVVLLVLFIAATYFVAPAVAKAVDKDTVDQVDKLRDDRDKAAAERDTAQKELDDAKKGTDQAKIQEEQQQYDTAKANFDKADDALIDESGKLQGIYYAVFGGFFLIGALYLIVPTIATGATPGKRFQHLKVLRDDGSPLRAGDAIKRYGTLALVTFALFMIGLGPLAGGIVLIAVIGWTRNPNMQGMHDRFFHTMVVTDDIN
jgi:curved DNA-binding protein CbpA